MLSQIEIDKIKDAAQEVYELTTKDVFGIPVRQMNELQKERRQAYITGATISLIKEKQKSQLLIGALENAKLHISSEVICENIDETITKYLTTG